MAQRVYFDDYPPSPLSIEPDAVTGRRFPVPWTAEQIAGSFVVRDANEQEIAYVYARANPADAHIAKVLTLDEARRIAKNIAKLPTLLNAKRRVE